MRNLAAARVLAISGFLLAACATRADEPIEIPTVAELSGY